MSKPIINVKGNIQHYKKIKNIKPKQSNVLLTINRNRQFKEDDPNLKNDIEIYFYSINQLLNNIGEFFKIYQTLINGMMKQ